MRLVLLRTGAHGNASGQLVVLQGQLHDLLLALQLVAQGGVAKGNASVQLLHRQAGELQGPMRGRVAQLVLVL